MFTQNIITDEDRLASAFFWKNEAATKKYRAKGISLRGDSLVGVTPRRSEMLTLSQNWIANKEFGNFAENHVDPSDWKDPVRDPFLTANDLESVN